MHDLINHVSSLNLAHLIKVPLPSKSTDKPAKSPVTATDNISTEQPPDPNTQVTGDSLLSNSSLLSVSSKVVPSRHPVYLVQDSSTYDLYWHPHKSLLQPCYLPHLLGDRYFAQYSQQHVVSHVAQVSSRELQADCMNTSSTETVCSLNAPAESDAFSDAQDKLPDTVDICTNMNALEGGVIGNTNTKQLSEYTQPIQDVQQNLSAPVYDHINQPEPLNLTRDTPGKPLPCSRPTKEPVAAIDSSSPEQLVEPCTQATDYLLAQRVNDSFLLNSSFSSVSSLANPHCHLDQSSLQPDRLSGRYPAEMHQPVSSPDGHRLSCEGHANYMSATSTDQTACIQDTAGDNDAFFDPVDRLPHTMNTGMLVNELEDEVFSNQENDSCLELEPQLPFVTEIKEPETVVCAPKVFDKMTTETIAPEILISKKLNRTVSLHDPWNVTESALKNLIERNPGTSKFVDGFVVKEAPAEATPTEKEHTPLMASYALSSFLTDKASTSSLSRRDGSHLALTSTVTH